ncbi:hypothetical protein Dimus_009404 [Dionaea muscipula]
MIAGDPAIEFILSGSSLVDNNGVVFGRIAIYSEIEGITLVTCATYSERVSLRLLCISTCLPVPSVRVGASCRRYRFLVPESLELSCFSSCSFGLLSFGVGGKCDLSFDFVCEETSERFGARLGAVREALMGERCWVSFSCEGDTWRSCVEGGFWEGVLCLGVMVITDLGAFSCSGPGKCGYISSFLGASYPGDRVEERHASFSWCLTRIDRMCYRSDFGGSSCSILGSFLVSGVFVPMPCQVLFIF